MLGPPEKRRVDGTRDGMGTVPYSHLAKVTFNSIPEVVHELGYKIQLQGRVVGRFSKQPS